MKDACIGPIIFGAYNQRDSNLRSYYIQLDMVLLVRADIRRA